MNYDKAYELARAIRESDEYRSLKSTQDLINKDPDAKRMLDDFRKRQFELQMKQMQGETISPDEMEKMQRLYETIQLHAQIRILLEKERIMMQVMEDINRIIAEPLQELFQQ